MFLHVTVSEPPKPWWGNILKSNSNGTYYGLSMDYVNRNEAGFVDFEKMIGLDGIALINIISNPQEASMTGRKELQSRITHNDGMLPEPHAYVRSGSLNYRWNMEASESTLKRLAW